MRKHLLSAKRPGSGDRRRKFLSGRAQALAVVAAVLAAFVLPPITTADAAAIWNHPARDFRVNAAPPSQGLDPAYQAPAAAGVSYKSPPVGAPMTRSGLRSTLRASGLGSLLMIDHKPA